MSTSTTEISWTDRTWNPTRGCSRVSPGCENCYAEKLAVRFSGPGRPYDGLVRMGKNGPRWTGKMQLVEHALAEPLGWKAPARIFVNSMSDLFHEALSDEQIAAVFGVMAACPQHTFQILTKRAERMARWFADIEPGTGVDYCAAEARARVDRPLFTGDAGWPLPNVWIGVSVEDQQRADERVPHLIRTPAAVRFLSCEPLLGVVDLEAINQGKPILGAHDGRGRPLGVDWVIAGGESGHGARPTPAGAFEVLAAQTERSGVAFFMKQLGAVWAKENGAEKGDPKGGDFDRLPAALRRREWPEIG